MSKRFASMWSPQSPNSAMVKTHQQTLMEQLGIADEDLKEQTSSSDSDGDEVQPMESALSSRLNPPPAALDETGELRQMLRETQRKLRTAQSSLAESERSRERRLKIMRKTHQSALAMKQELVQELQDIITEKDELLQAGSGGGGVTGNSGVAATATTAAGGGLGQLVEQLCRLQREHSSLQARSQPWQEEIQQLREDKERLLAEQQVTTATTASLRMMSPRRPASPALAQQARALQQKVLRLEQERLTNTSHASTAAAEHHKQLQAQIVELKVQLRTEQEEKENVIKSKTSSHAAEVAQLVREVATLQKHNLELQQEKEKLDRAKAESHAELVAGLQREKSELKQRVQSLEESVRTVENGCEDLKATLQESQSKSAEERAVLEGQCSELHCELAGWQDRLRAAVAEAEVRGRSQATSALSRLATLHSTAAQAHTSATAVRSSVTELSSSIAVFNGTLQQDLASASHKICMKLCSVSEQNRSLVGRYRREMALRKQLHDRLVELLGNIRVLARVRPPITEDGAGEAVEVVVQQDSEDDGLLCVRSRGSWKQFELDRVFGPSSSQEQVFEQVRPLVTSCMDGYNVCIFAYGQTGSGKTHTMEGPPHDPGINQRALLELFSVVEERGDDWDYSIVVSVLEIYNEAVRDLLSVSCSERLEVKQGPAGVYVPGLTQVRVTCLEEVNEVFALGRENRATGSTRMNIHSSRSHALLCVTVMGVSRTTGMQTTGKLNLIDLAGSERLDKSGSDGVRLLEARHINRSLSALGDVIHALRARSPHTPYRNSKLTFLLQDSLSGESKTLMVVQVAPVHKNAGETVCSLNFAQRVRAVELGQAKKKTVMPTS